MNKHLERNTILKLSLSIFCVLCISYSSCAQQTQGFNFGNAIFSQPNYNHTTKSSAKNFQYEKQSVCYLLFYSKSKGDLTQGTGFLVNTINNSFSNGNKEIYLLTVLHNDITLESDDDEKNGVYLNFGFESTSPIANKETISGDDINAITTFWKVNLEPIMLDEDSDIALYRIKQVPESWTIENSEVFQHVYASGWAQHFKNVTLFQDQDEIYNIGHPNGDFKNYNVSNVYANTALLNGHRPIGTAYDPNSPFSKVLENRVLYGVPHLDAFFTSDGSSGSPLFNANKNAIGILSSGGFRSRTMSGHRSRFMTANFTLLQNSWYQKLQQTLDPEQTWISQVPGGYLRDLEPYTGEDIEFDFEVNTIGEETLLRLQASDFFRFEHLATLTEETLQDGVVPAQDNPNPIVFLVEAFTEQQELIYGVIYDQTEPMGNGVFKGIPWSAQNNTYGLALPTDLNNQSNAIKSNILQYMRFRNSTMDEITMLSVFDINTVAHLRSLSVGGTSKVRAIKLPAIMPHNAVELFKPERFDDLWKSYKYPNSQLISSKTFHIQSTTISQELEEGQGDDTNENSNENYNRTITTDNNGGYVNLVQSTYKIGPIKASIDNQTIRHIKLDIKLENTENKTYSYSTWIDYYNRDHPEGKNTSNYTYNFVDDPIAHPKEKLESNQNQSGSVIHIEQPIPTYTDLGLQPGEKRQTRLRVAVMEGNNSPAQSQSIGNGEVEDYLIEIVAPTEKELKENQRIKAFEKISMADGSTETQGNNLPQGESGNRLGSGNDDAAINNDLAYLYDNSFINNLGMDAFLIGVNEAINAVRVGVNAIDFDGLAHIFVGGAVGGGGGGDFIYDPYNKHTSTYDLIPDLVCEDLNGDGECDNQRRTNTITNYQIVYEEGGGDNGLSLRFNSTNIQYGVRINNQLQVIDYPYDLLPNQYMNLTIVFNDGLMELYVDGSKVATNNTFATTGITTIPAHLDHAGLGGISGTGSIWDDDTENVNFHGMIDYFGYTNKVLSETEIADLTTPSLLEANKSASPLVGSNSDTPLLLKEDPTPLDFSIFPNPASDKLNILVEVRQEGPLQMDIYDMSGRQVYTINRPKINQGHQLINLRDLNLSAGNYILRIKAGNDMTVSKKIIFK